MNNSDRANNLTGNGAEQGLSVSNLTRSSSGELDVYALRPDAMVDAWPLVERHITAGLSFGYDPYELGVVRSKLISGELIAIVVHERGVADPLFVVTLEIVNIVNVGRVCNMVSGGGERMVDWVDRLDEILTAVAREQGCVMLTTNGRPGWARALKPFGFEHLYTVCGKRIEP